MNLERKGVNDLNQNFIKRDHLSAEYPLRKHMDFYGRVQGVGFRYTVYNYARSYGLTGWVRNCSDGHVEMEIQGSEERIQAVLEELQRDRWIRIEKLDQRKIPLVTGEKEFKVVG